jgi:uncharacterized membrane protein YtjA (UPF0391 family)
MFAISVLLLGVTIITGLLGFSATPGMKADLILIIFSAFCALFVISLVLNIASWFGERQIH